jgi:hypothetical protein
MVMRYSKSGKKWVDVAYLESEATPVFKLDTFTARQQSTNPSQHRVLTHRKPGSFGIIGNTPWLQRAFRAGKRSDYAPVIAVILQIQFTLNGGRPIVLTRKIIDEWGLTDRFKKYRALSILEKADLITVQRNGKSPAVITLINQESDPDGDHDQLPA